MPAAGLRRSIRCRYPPVMNNPNRLVPCLLQVWGGLSGVSPSRASPSIGSPSSRPSPTTRWTSPTSYPPHPYPGTHTTVRDTGTQSVFWPLLKVAVLPYQLLIPLPPCLIVPILLSFFSSFESASATDYWVKIFSNLVGGPGLFEWWKI